MPVKNYIVFGMRECAVYTLLVLLIVPGSLRAQIVAGSWEKVDALQRGSVITLTPANGKPAEYRFVASSQESLLVTDSDGKEHRIAKFEVRAVERKRADRLRNGILIGTAVGFGSGFSALAAFNNKQTASGPLWDREAVGYYVAAGLIGAGIGALTGAAIDGGKKGTEILYVRP